MTKSHYKASRVVSLLPCVGRANARDPHTKDSGLAVMGAERRFPQGREGQRRADSRPRSVSPVTQKETSTQVSARTCPTLNTTRRVSRERASTVHSTSARHETLHMCGRRRLSLVLASTSPTAFPGVHCARRKGSAELTLDRAQSPPSRKKRLAHK